MAHSGRRCEGRRVRTRPCVRGPHGSAHCWARAAAAAAALSVILHRRDYTLLHWVTLHYHTLHYYTVHYCSSTDALLPQQHRCSSAAAAQERTCAVSGATHGWCERQVCMWVFFFPDCQWCLKCGPGRCVRVPFRVADCTLISGRVPPDATAVCPCSGARDLRWARMRAEPDRSPEPALRRLRRARLRLGSLPRSLL
jgi:hypothetical protein